MIKHSEAEQLLEKYKNGSITTEEFQLLEAWYNERAITGIDDISDQELEENLNQVWLQLNPVVKPIRTKLWKRVIAAAAILLVVGTSLFLYRAGQIGAANKLIVNNDIAPGGNRAFLTLANGKKIWLGNEGKGTLAKESGVVISKSADGQLIYTISDDKKEDEGKTDQYNSIETPRGGQYQVVLPDGTRVWLNAASVLKYPVRFSRTKRAVELIGEAYFEVTKDQSKPFVLSTADQVITVLGTHFNVNAYPEEKSRRTTLLEGSVRVSLTNIQHPVLLKPGEEYESQNGKVDVREVNALESVAWKNGEFIFNDEPLESIMNKIARWYDVNVSYEHIDPATRFGGTVSRFTQVSKVLEKLQLTGGVGFRITGRNITVTK